MSVIFTSSFLLLSSTLLILVGNTSQHDLSWLINQVKLYLNLLCFHFSSFQEPFKCLPDVTFSSHSLFSLLGEWVPKDTAQGKCPCDTHSASVVALYLSPQPLSPLGIWLSSLLDFSMPRQEVVSDCGPHRLCISTVPLVLTDYVSPQSLWSSAGP